MVFRRCCCWSNKYTVLRKEIETIEILRKNQAASDKIIADKGRIISKQATKIENLTKFGIIRHIIHCTAFWTFWVFKGL